MGVSSNFSTKDHLLAWLQTTCRELGWRPSCILYWFLCVDVISGCVMPTCWDLHYISLVPCPLSNTIQLPLHNLTFVEWPCRQASFMQETGQTCLVRNFHSIVSNVPMEHLTVLACLDHFYQVMLCCPTVLGTWSFLPGNALLPYSSWHMRAFLTRLAKLHFMYFLPCRVSKGRKPCQNHVHDAAPTLQCKGHPQVWGLSTDSMDGRIFWFLVNLALGNFFVTISPLSILAYTIVSTRLDIACTKIKIQVSVCWNLYKDSSLHGKRTRPFHYIKVWHGRLNNTYQNSCSNRHFLHYYKCMMIMRRSCQIMGARKWDNLWPLHAWSACSSSHWHSERCFN